VLTQASQQRECGLELKTPSDVWEAIGSGLEGNIPANPDSTSALGLLLTDIRHDCVRTFCVATMMRLAATFKRLSMSLCSGDVKPPREISDRTTAAPG
jgi:hypothetical protein